MDKLWSTVKTAYRCYKKLSSKGECMCICWFILPAMDMLMCIVSSVYSCLLPPYISIRTGYQENNYFTLSSCSESHHLCRHEL